MLRTFLSLAVVAMTAQANGIRSPNDSNNNMDLMPQDERDLNTRLFGRTRDLRITVTNLAYQQPMSPFFVMVHNDNVTPLFTLGAPEPGYGLDVLAELGDPSILVGNYGADPNAEHVMAVQDQMEGMFPAMLLEGGESFSFDVTVSREYPLVSLASMAVNTNDCFVGMAGMRLSPGMSFTLPGYDSGTEENNESCISVPGPACMGQGTAASGNGEGFVHVHRGIQGVFGNEMTDLAPETYDWRNPMLLVTVESAY